MDIKDIRKIVDNDKETKNLEINDGDLYRVYQYIIMRDTLEKDADYIPRLLTHPYVEIVYIPSERKKKQLQAEKLKENLKFFDSETFVQDANLEAFKKFNGEREKVYDLAQEFLKNYTKDKYYKGLYIYGAYSTGKTFVLSAIAKELAQRNSTVLLVFMPDLVRNIKQGMNEGNLEQRVNQLKQVDVLMIDDLGGENISAWFRDEILVPVLQYRLSAQLPVFISSNLDMKSLAEAFAETKNERDLVKAMRLIQRIKDLTTYVKLSETKYE